MKLLEFELIKDYIWGVKIIFGVMLFLQNFDKISYATIYYWWVKNDINIEPKLELVIIYHKWFVIQLLRRYCGYSITLIFIEPKFLWFSSQNVQHFF